MLCGSLISLAVSAQMNHDQVLMTIGDDEIHLSEFLRVYEKNQGVGYEEDKKSLDEYLEMFINFKLKVHEAETLGMDTLAKFKRELNGYRNQLARPYLIDSKVTERLVEEAYERLQWEVSASHILINLDETARASDTVEAYNKAMKLRELIVKGADFETVAKQNSEDPSAGENGGYLGYFSALYMVYPFETAAYNTPVGGVSMPVRTRFGYHIIKVHNKRPARGEVKVAHIMIKANDRMSEEERAKARTKIDELHVRLRNGEDFSELAELYSDDKHSARKGGELPMFGINEMLEPFEEAAFSLKNLGDFSEPVKTVYGWHILQLKDKKGLEPFDKMKYELESRIQKDSRAELSKKVFIDRLKKEYGFVEYLNERDDFYKLLNADYFKAAWMPDRAYRYKSTIFKFAGKSYKQTDFTDYIVSRQVDRAPKETIPHLVNRLYEEFVETTILNYENERLEEKHEEFRHLMKEYRDGILLFELMGDKVWNKATRDSAGLKEFFEARRSVYMWGNRIDASVVSCANKKMAKKALKYLNKEKPVEWILEKLNTDSELNVTMERGVYAKGDDLFVDENEWNLGGGAFKTSDSGVKFLYVHKKIAAEPKELMEARGVVIADYQSYLEQEWIKGLREKYPVTIHKEILEQVK